MNIHKYSSLSSGSSWIGKQQFLAVLNDLAILFPVFLLIFTWRGFVQALTAKIMGDRTAERDGFLTLNPLAHIDLYGFMIVMGVFFVLGGLFYNVMPRAVLLMILILFGVRWTIPVPINDSKFRSYRLGGIITTLSGPLANFLLAFIAIGLMRLCLSTNLPANITNTLLEIFKNLIHVALFFGVLDLIPLPPFDGGRMLRYLLPYSSYHTLQKLEEYSLFILLVLFFAPGISDIFFGGIFVIASIIKKLMLSVFF